MKDQKKKERILRILLINLFNLVLKRLPSANPPVRSVIRAKRKLQAERRSSSGAITVGQLTVLLQDITKRTVSQMTSLFDEELSTWTLPKSQAIHIYVYIYTCRNNGSIAETIFCLFHRSNVISMYCPGVFDSI